MSVGDKNSIIDTAWNQYDLLLSLNETKQNDTESCSNCYGNEFTIDNSEGIVVCILCGVIKENKVIDYSPEWSFHDYETASYSKGERCGDVASVLCPIIGSSTKIAGNTNLSKYSKWMNTPYNEVILLKLADTLLRKCHNQFRAHTIYSSIYLFKLYRNNKKDTKISIQRGVNSNVLVGVCLYYTCIDQNIEKTPAEISGLLDIDPKEFSRGCKNFTEQMQNSKEISHIFLKLVDPKRLITNYIISLEQNYNLVNICHKILDAVTELHLLVNKTPQTIAASIVYFVILEFNLFTPTFTRKYILDVLKCTDTTIIKVMKTLQQYKQELFNIVKNSASAKLDSS
jgi:transcription initiation factor TFIIIB Brf1 subunit/transcription initiation factor TFIIB